MIGNDITLNITGPYEGAPHFYWAQQQDGCRALAYVAGQGTDVLRGRVIAEATLEGCGRVSLAAPYGVELYLPDITQAIGRAKDVLCMYEKSCGALVYIEKDGRNQYFIIENRHHNWGFPKGHVERGEDEHQTARREIFEEAGLRPEFVEGFRESISYYVRENVRKTAVYFLARSDSEAVVLAPGEISSYKLLPFRQAHRQLTYQSEKDLLRSAERFLKARRRDDGEK